ncbi:MAG: Cytochrome c oxidase polypeptide II [Nitrosopumilales archaeon]|nr:MAG: Cytochrome c oxidase polypeptide II [Nitrosopumilales archaeon]
MSEHGNWAEWVYIGVVCALLVWVGAEAWNVERLVEHVPADAEVIKVTAQQWFWSFEHEDGTIEIGELHVEKGKAYKFEVTSKDVIHSFNIHDYVVLIDAVPGRINTVWFAPDEVAEHEIQCREYCGLLHYNMRAKLYVEGST